MKKIKIIINLLLLSLLYSCNSASDAAKILRNEKITNTDEFFVKKRDPLILPPDYSTLPTPNSKEEKKETEKDKINQILKLPSESSNASKKPSSVEESIMKRIKKWLITKV